MRACARWVRQKICALSRLVTLSDPQRGLPQTGYDIAIGIHIAGVIFYVTQVIRDILDPRRDPVRPVVRGGTERLTRAVHTRSDRIKDRQLPDILITYTKNRRHQDMLPAG